MPESCSALPGITCRFCQPAQSVEGGWLPGRTLLPKCLDVVLRHIPPRPVWTAYLPQLPEAPRRSGTLHHPLLFLIEATSHFPHLFVASPLSCPQIRFQLGGPLLHIVKQAVSIFV